MKPASESAPPAEATRPRNAVLAACAVGVGASYQAAFARPSLAWLALVSLALVIELRRARTPRAAFWLGTLAGAGVFVPRLGFLWGLFGFQIGGWTVSLVAPVLWMILASFHGVFVVLLRAVGLRLGSRAALCAAPVAWMGIEYLRSEAWWLRFPWFTIGEALDAYPALVRDLGVYGLGAAAAAVAALALAVAESPRGGARGAPRFAAVLAIAVGLATAWVARPVAMPTSAGKSVEVAGLQLETPAVQDILTGLDRVVALHPRAELVVCGEYSLDGPPPESLKRWCVRQRRWLLIGGTEAVVDSGTPDAAAATLRGGGTGTTPFRNTAFVVGPSGNIEFTQAKSVPIQFFQDGLPAATQRVWESPWGRIGIAVCYDAGYRRVMDGLVRGGAEALVVIAMDAEAWGDVEHGLNSRITRLRGLEYGLPLARLATSGISGVYDARGAELARAGFPGQGETLSGTLRFAGPSRVPWDAWFGPCATVATTALAAWLAFASWRERGFGFGKRAGMKTP